MKKYLVMCKEYVKDCLSRFYEDDSGVGVVEVILILVVLIGLVVLFKDQLTSIVNNIFSRIVNETNAL